MTRRCELPDCESEHVARGLCEKHYRAWKRHGDPQVSLAWKGRSSEDRFWARVAVAEENECWLWSGATVGTEPFQYGTLMHDSRKMGAHRFSYLLHRGSIPEGLEVCHSCDTTRCVNPAHLFLGTHADNMKDMIAKGRADNTGERNGRSKLTAKQVAYIRNQATGRYGEISSFAREFGVGTGTMSKILKHQTWT